MHPDVKRFVHVSSLTAYGPSNNGPTQARDRPREPVEHYGRSKLEAELAVEEFGEALPWTIIRPASSTARPRSTCSRCFKAAKLGVNLFFGNRDKRASAVYVDDLLEAMVQAAQSPETRGRGYFICDGVPYTWGDIQGHIARAVGRRDADAEPAGLCRAGRGRRGRAAYGVRQEAALAQSAKGHPGRAARLACTPRRRQSRLWLHARGCPWPRARSARTRGTSSAAGSEPALARAL